MKQAFKHTVRLIVLEMQLWASLFMWLFRSHRRRPQEFSYHKQSLFGVFLVAALFSSPIEILLFELLIPWAWLRWVLLIASLYTLIWVSGYYASLVVHPHRLEADGLRLRYGALADGFIPYSGIVEVARQRQRLPKKSRGLFVDAARSAAYFGMDGTTNVVLRLDSPQPLCGFFALTAPVATISLALDEPERFVREVRQRLESVVEHVRAS
jgi:hypothetical protein